MNPQPGASARRRQWGSERRRAPLPSVHPRPSDRRITWGRLAIVVTVVAWLAYVVSTIVRQFLDYGTGFRFTMEAVSYLVVVTFLTFSALMYLIMRQGALERFRDHRRVPRAELDRHFATRRGGMTVLIPSYAEETDVVRQTMWSAALQDYPGLRVVLLLDDPPAPTDPVVRARLDATRALADQLADALRGPAARFAAAEERARHLDASSWVGSEEVADLAADYLWAAAWLDAMADAEPTGDHVDEFFVEQILRGLATDLRDVGKALGAAVAAEEAPSRARMTELRRRLVWTFTAEFSTFERKKYASLSHEANKAMNLNSYIGLMGRSFRFDETPNGTVLREVVDGYADLEVPDTEFLLTLDADSLLLREYCLRLVQLMDQPEHDRVAVAQTPYSAFRGAGTRIERLAGATTDIQHILHQGMTRFDATFWVGANAVIRKRALEDIVEIEQQGGFEVRRYVQDRTVIEDTESSIDLGRYGWTLVNYPERLSYSATPPDFGSLVVQRRRWANGGLLILPKLWREARQRRRDNRPLGTTEVLIRVNYMASIAWATFGLLFLLAFPYDSRLLSPFVLGAALPYFLAMASDLRSMGYRGTDVIRIYGFNLILLPVNLAGVLKSLQQAISGKKIPFARTPKIKDRTSTPIPYLIAPVLIIAFSAFTFVRDVTEGNWANAAFAAVNAVLTALAAVSYIGVGSMIVDLGAGIARWLFVERAPRREASAEAPAPAPDWRMVLYTGSAPTGAEERDELEVAA
jgi:cellulose synthase/poly-beta-1,6-N-acetylglucosamine synthase-like glycosyltransferase